MRLLTASARCSFKVKYKCASSAQPLRSASSCALRTSMAPACAEAYAPNPPSMLAIATIAHIRLRTGVSHRCAGKARLCCQCKQCDKGRCADQRGSAKRLRREQKVISPFQKARVEKSIVILLCRCDRGEQLARRRQSYRIACGALKRARLRLAFFRKNRTGRIQQFTAGVKQRPYCPQHLLLARC